MADVDTTSACQRGTTYKEYTHVSDILFLKIMSVLIQKYFKKEKNIEDINSKTNEIITERNRISKLEGSEETKELHKIVGKHGKNPSKEKLLKTCFPSRHICMIKY